MLQPGDFIFTCRYDSALLWAVMYFTSSEINHVAMYHGDGEIMHSTLSGVRKEPIETLYDADARLLPLRVGLDPGKWDALRARMERDVGRPFGWRSVRKKFVRIVSGRDVAYFRWRFVVDAALAAACCDAALVLIGGRPIFTWLVPLYVGVVLVNRILWHARPVPADSDYIKPIDLYRVFVASGAQSMFDGSALDDQRRQLGLDSVRPRQERGESTSGQELPN